MRDRCDLRVAAVSHFLGPVRGEPRHRVRKGAASRAPGRPTLRQERIGVRAEGRSMRKRVIRAGEIEIEDSEGRVRARFGVTNDDLPVPVLLRSRREAPRSVRRAARRVGRPRDRGRRREGARHVRALLRRLGEHGDGRPQREGAREVRPAAPRARRRSRCGTRTASSGSSTRSPSRARRRSRSRTRTARSARASASRPRDRRSSGC